MKKGKYILVIDDHDDNVEVEVIGGISDTEIVQLFGFCVCRLVELGAEPEELKELVDVANADFKKELINENND